MTGQQSETSLRNALDAVDSVRRRVFAGGWVAVAVTLAAYYHLAYVHRTSNDIERLVMAAVTALTCLVGWATFAVILIVLRMTKRILRAIDLSAVRRG